MLSVIATGSFVTQSFLAAQWYRVTPFALSSSNEFRSFIHSFGPAMNETEAYVQQAKELIELSVNLTDEQKMIAEYWKDGPHSETPPGHWCLLAQSVSQRDHHTLEQDVKMFFMVTNALFDASIAAWDAKRAFDSVRPATAIPYLFHGQQIRSWGGPNQGAIIMDGANWIPYQPSDFPTPPFPEYISGHSTFSAAAATVLQRFTQSDRFGASVTFPPGSSLVEPGSVPATPLALYWRTFSDAADQAGMSAGMAVSTSNGAIWLDGRPESSSGYAPTRRRNYCSKEIDRGSIRVSRNSRHACCLAGRSLWRGRLQRGRSSSTRCLWECGCFSACPLIRCYRDRLLPCPGSNLRDTLEDRHVHAQFGDDHGGQGEVGAGDLLQQRELRGIGRNHRGWESNCFIFSSPAFPNTGIRFLP